VDERKPLPHPPDQGHGRQRAGGGRAHAPRPASLLLLVAPQLLICRQCFKAIHHIMVSSAQFQALSKWFHGLNLHRPTFCPGSSVGSPGTAASKSRYSFIMRSTVWSDAAAGMGGTYIFRRPLSCSSGATRNSLHCMALSRRFSAERSASDASSSQGLTLVHLFCST